MTRGRNRSRHGWLLLVFAVLFTVVVAFAAVPWILASVFKPPENGPGGTATRPVPQTSWVAVKLFEQQRQEAREREIDLLFLGDSITEAWNDPRVHPVVWKRYYEPRHAANFGIGGDRTQHLLWRLDHGALDDVDPKVIVLQVGTNNLENNTPDEIYEGVKAIVGRIRDALPRARILLLGIFPRGKNPGPIREEIKAVNARIAELDAVPNVTYRDFGDRFLNGDGTISKKIMPDYLHLSRKGYRIWAEAMEPTLWRLMEK